MGGGGGGGGQGGGAAGSGNAGGGGPPPPPLPQETTEAQREGVRVKEELLSLRRELWKQGSVGGYVIHLVSTVRSMTAV